MTSVNFGGGESSPAAPGPIAGAGLPGLILASGGLLGCQRCGSRDGSHDVDQVIRAAGARGIGPRDLLVMPFSAVISCQLRGWGMAALRRIIWNKSQSPTRYVSDRLGIERKRFRAALHKIKAAADVKPNERIVIYDNGDVTDANGEPIGNINDEF